MINLGGIHIGFLHSSLSPSCSGFPSGIMWCSFSNRHKESHSKAKIFLFSKAAHVCQSPVHPAVAHRLPTSSTTLLVVLLQEGIRLWIHHQIQQKDGFTISSKSNTAGAAESSSQVTGRQMEWMCCRYVDKQGAVQECSELLVSKSLLHA